MKNLSIAVGIVMLVAFMGCTESPSPFGPNETTPVILEKNEVFEIPQEGIIPDSYIVILSSKLPDIEKTKATGRIAKLEGIINQLRGMHQFEVAFHYENCLTGFAAKMNARAAEALARNPMVERIEPDRFVYAIAKNQQQVTPLGINRIDVDISSTVAGNGSGSVTGVEVYIIDTGIQTNHPDLNVVGGINYAGGSSNSYNDGNGHGTHVAGTVGAKDNTSHVVGVAPGVPLYAVRVLNNAGVGSMSGVIAGVNWVTGRKTGYPSTPMVANMSLGMYAGSTLNALDNAVKNSINAGITYAIAAGNEQGDAGLYSPAHVVEAITVGAYDASNNTWANFSNYGQIVDILAPGVNVLSTYKGSATAYMSGTSMAAPHVAGTAALYLSRNPGASPVTVVSEITSKANLRSPSPSPNIINPPSPTTNLSVYAGDF